MKSEYSIKIVVLIALLVCILGISLFALTSIKTISTSIPVSRSIMSPFIGSSLFTISKKDVLTAIQKKMPNVSDITLQRQFPNKLHIIITTQKPVALLKNNDVFYALNTEARILDSGIASHSALPIVTLYQDLPIRPKKYSVIPLTDVKYTIQLIHELEQKYSNSVKYADIIEPTVIFLQMNESQSIFVVTSQKSVAKNAFFVHNSMKELSKQKIKASRVDLRFDKPVVIQ